jgi:hypothetical protein
MPEQTKVTLTLSIDELNIVIMGLVKLPYETSAPLVDIVRTQANEQLNAQGGNGVQTVSGSDLPPSKAAKTN